MGHIMKKMLQGLFLLCLGIGLTFAQSVDKRRAQIQRQYQEAIQKATEADAKHKMTVSFANEDVNFGLIEKQFDFFYDNTQEEVNSNRLYLVRVVRKEPKSSIHETTDYLFDPVYPLGRFIMMSRDFSSSVYRIEDSTYSDGTKPFLVQSKQTEVTSGKVVSNQTWTKNIQDMSAQQHSKELLNIFNNIANPK